MKKKTLSGIKDNKPFPIHVKIMLHYQRTVAEGCCTRHVFIHSFWLSNRDAGNSNIKSHIQTLLVQ